MSDLRDIIEALPDGMDYSDCELTTIAALRDEHNNIESGHTTLSDGDCAILVPGYYAADSSGYDLHFPLADTGEEAAREYIEGGDWGNSRSTQFIEANAWRKAIAYSAIDDDVAEIQFDFDGATVEIEPDAPDCEAGHSHEWESPHSVVGGIEDNPGVQGHGGGVFMRTVCRHCGAYRVVDTWAQNPNNGEQGLTSVAYEDADEQSLAWAESLREDD